MCHTQVCVLGNIAEANLNKCAEGRHTALGGKKKLARKRVQDAVNTGSLHNTHNLLTEAYIT